MNGRWQRLNIGRTPVTPVLPESPDLIIDHLSTSFDIPRGDLSRLADGAISCGPYEFELALNDLINFLPKSKVDARIMDAYFGIFKVLFPDVHYITWEDTESVLVTCHNLGERKVRSDLLLSLIPDDDVKRIIFPLQRATGWAVILVDASNEEEITVRPIMGYSGTGATKIYVLVKALTRLINILGEDEANVFTGKFVYNMSRSGACDQIRHRPKVSSVEEGRRLRYARVVNRAHTFRHATQAPSRG